MNDIARGIIIADLIRIGATVGLILIIGLIGFVSDIWGKKK